MMILWVNLKLEHVYMSCEPLDVCVNVSAESLSDASPLRTEDEAQRP